MLISIALLSASCLSLSGLRAKAAASRSDREALNRWDQLVKRQQRRLEEVRVPPICDTASVVEDRTLTVSAPLPAFL